MYPPESKSEWKDKEHEAEVESLKADNAAFLAFAQQMARGNGECAWCHGEDGHRDDCPVMHAVALDHPGSALLKELKALRERVKTLEDDLRQKAADMLERQASVATARAEALEEAQTAIYAARRQCPDGLSLPETLRIIEALKGK